MLQSPPFSSLFRRGRALKSSSICCAGHAGCSAQRRCLADLLNGERKEAIPSTRGGPGILARDQAKQCSYFQVITVSLEASISRNPEFVASKLKSGVSVLISPCA